MKKLTVILPAIALAAITAGAAAPDSFESQLIKSGYIHSPLPLDTVNSLDAYAARKQVLAERTLDTRGRWRHQGEGYMTETPGGAAMTYAHNTGRRAVGSPDDPDYANYGRCGITLDLQGENWEDYNRLVFDITPKADGSRVTIMNLGFNNSHDAAPKAGYNQPTGGHQINLRNGERNTCYLEIADLQRDRMGSLSFGISLNGRDRTTGDSATYIIDNIRLQRVPLTDKVSGWAPDPNFIIYSMTGYAADGRKTAIVADSHAGADFTLLRGTDGSVAGKFKATPTTTTTGTFGVIDFSAITEPGTYTLQGDGLETRPFSIGTDDMWDPSRWKVLNYIFSQRCGYDVPGIHSTCHTDLRSVHGDLSIPYCGGWHDAGDLSQQTLQTAEVAHALFEAYNAARDRNPILAARLLEEARWGLDFALRNRYGDGYRASSMGLLIWQDGIHGSGDDIHTVRVQNVSYDNYLYAALGAYAAQSLADSDPMLAQHLIKVAEEDFAFAEETFAQKGYGGFIKEYEHTFNTSPSQHHATVSWAASKLYQATGNEKYARIAADNMDYVLACQHTDAVGGKPGLAGFFYRDKDRRSIVHFIHQSRDQLYMQALAELCRTQPDNSDKAKWENAMRLYGNYLKELMAYTAPYGMVPSGVYADNEYEDRDGFFALHLFPPSNAAELFAEQLQQGEKVGDHHYVKRFPVWFNVFNGNCAVHTSTGKAAAILANYFGDDELRDIAREQLYWVVGKNPFAQSLIFGEGHRFPQMNSFSCGEMTGEMPVGIRTIGNTDEPYWPQINNACYKEVWVTSAGKWLSLLAELDNHN
ncbi:MAG: glycosyl hydrolase family 9 [Bacteroidales bacterium]|nr:glycosyl hydrolase family 9 [Bacteroidales bacterium]